MHGDLRRHLGEKYSSHVPGLHINVEVADPDPTASDSRRSHEVVRISWAGGWRLFRPFMTTRRRFDDLLDTLSAYYDRSEYGVYTTPVVQCLKDGISTVLRVVDRCGQVYDVLIAVRGMVAEITIATRKPIVLRSHSGQ
jgi:hypothetical protein